MKVSTSLRSCKADQLCGGVDADDIHTVEGEFSREPPLTTAKVEHAPR
jgi:hypothetical protein